MTTIDQSSWPEHLRDDAPYQRCGRCRRCTWSTEEFGAECRMAQFGGQPCDGRFGPETFRGAAVELRQHDRYPGRGA